MAAAPACTDAADFLRRVREQGALRGRPGRVRRARHLVPRRRRRSAGGAAGWQAVGAPGDPRSDVVAECPLASLPRVSDAVGATREP